MFLSPLILHQSSKDCQALVMKLLIVLGLIPLFSALPFSDDIGTQVQDLKKQIFENIL